MLRWYEHVLRKPPNVMIRNEVFLWVPELKAGSARPNLIKGKIVK